MTTKAVCAVAVGPLDAPAQSSLPPDSANKPSQIALNSDNVFGNDDGVHRPATVTAATRTAMRIFSKPASPSTRLRRT